MELKEKLSKEILDSGWDPIAPHFARGSVYLLDYDLDIVEVGEAMATDNVSAIKQWLDDGLMSPPTSEEATAFAKSSDLFFNMLIIEPYVLIQRKLQS